MAAQAKRKNGRGWLDRLSYPATVTLLVVAGFFGLAVLPRVLAATHAMVGKPAPEVTLPVLWDRLAPPTGAARTIDLASLKGNVVVLDFWAPWCNPCRHEMPILDQLARRMAPQGVMVVGVMVDPDHDGALELIKRMGIGYPQLEDVQGKAQQAFDVRSLPSLVVLDRNGKVVSYHQGFTTEEDLEEELKKAMSM